MVRSGIDGCEEVGESEHSIEEYSELAGEEGGAVGLVISWVTASRMASTSVKEAMVIADMFDWGVWLVGLALMG